MSSKGGTSNVPPSPTVAKSKKSKKKKGGGVGKANGDAATTNGKPAKNAEDVAPSDSETGDATEEHKNIDESEEETVDTPAEAHIEDATSHKAPGNTSRLESTVQANGGDTNARLEALAQERSALKEEVVSLRKSLEEIQEKHEGELSKARKELEESQAAKEKAETNYNSLRDRVGTIRSQLGQRLKEDAEELAQCRSRIEELEEQASALTAKEAVQKEESTKLASQLEEQSKEIASLRSRSNLSSQNWSREKEDLLEREANLKGEFETAKQAMQDWEILAMEERSIRENLSERVGELEEQLITHREARERLEAERESQTSTVDGLQRALQELQEARKTELREVVENSQSQVEALRKELGVANTTATEATEARESTAKELERLLPLEAEVKEKNLLIGKLRHQAVGLNEHLTKAMRRLQRGRPDESIDRELVTNHFIHFLTLDRSDPRKFQILQIIASLLSWTDDQREQAGLARPGASNPSLRTPISPWNRTPSTPSLASEFGLPDRGRQDSVGGAFAEFLERESEPGTQQSRDTSVSGSRAAET